MLKRPEDMVVIARPETLCHAEVVKAMLEGAGIPAYIPSANATAMMPHMETALNPNGVRVLVRRADAEQARGILSNVEPLPPDAEDEAASPSQPQELTADDYIQRAVNCCFLGIIVPILPLTIPYLLYKAMRAGWGPAEGLAIWCWTKIVLVLLFSLPFIIGMVLLCMLMGTRITTTMVKMAE